MSVRVDTQIMSDGTVYLVSPRRPNLRKRVPKDQTIGASDLERAIGAFRAECDLCFWNGSGGSDRNQALNFRRRGPQQ